jgi:hypothetical protein
MKQLLTRTTGTHFTARLLGSSAVLLAGVALGVALWTATAPMSIAQGMTPQRMIETNLPQGQTMANANRQQLLRAVSAAARANRNQAPQIVRAAITARPDWAADILRAAFTAVGTGSDNCPLLARVLRAAIQANPDQASALTDLATSLAPDCASQFQQGTDEGVFGNAPGNQNPPPGSIGGGGASQGGRCQVCHRTGNGGRQTLTISCNAVPAHLRHGDTEGPCPVTPTQNP